MLSKDSTKSRNNRNASVVNLAEWRAGKINPPQPTHKSSNANPHIVDELIQTRIDLNHLLVERPQSTYYLTIGSTCSSARAAGLCAEDMIIVDRAAKAATRDLIIARINGELRVLVLQQDNIEGIEEIWGKVTCIIRRLNRSHN